MSSIIPEESQQPSSSRPSPKSLVDSPPNHPVLLNHLSTVSSHNLSSHEQLASSTKKEPITQFNVDDTFELVATKGQSLTQISPLISLSQLPSQPITKQLPSPQQSYRSTISPTSQPPPNEAQFDALTQQLIGYSHELLDVLESAKTNTSWMCVHNKFITELIEQSYKSLQQEHLPAAHYQFAASQPLSIQFTSQLELIASRLDSLLSCDRSLIDFHNQLSNFSAAAFDGTTPEMTAYKQAIISQEDVHLNQNLRILNERLSNQVSVLLSEITRQAEIKEQEIALLRESQQLEIADLQTQLALAKSDISRANKSAFDTQQALTKQVSTLKLEVSQLNGQVSSMLENSTQREQCLEQETQSLRAQITAIEAAVIKNPILYESSIISESVFGESLSLTRAAVEDINNSSCVASLKREFASLQLTPFNMKIDQLSLFLEEIRSVVGLLENQQKACSEGMLNLNEMATAFTQQVTLQFELIDNKIKQMTQNTENDSVELVFKHLEGFIAEKGVSLANNEELNQFQERICRILLRRDSDEEQQLSQIPETNHQLLQQTKLSSTTGSSSKLKTYMQKPMDKSNSALLRFKNISTPTTPSKNASANSSVVCTPKSKKRDNTSEIQVALVGLSECIAWFLKEWIAASNVVREHNSSYEVENLLPQMHEIVGSLQSDIRECQETDAGRFSLQKKVDEQLAQENVRLRQELMDQKALHEKSIEEVNKSLLVHEELYSKSYAELKTLKQRYTAEIEQVEQARKRIAISVKDSVQLVGLFEENGKEAAEMVRQVKKRILTDWKQVNRQRFPDLPGEVDKIKSEVQSLRNLHKKRITEFVMVWEKFNGKVNKIQSQEAVVGASTARIEQYLQVLQTEIQKFMEQNTKLAKRLGQVRGQNSQLVEQQHNFYNGLLGFLSPN